LYLLLQEVKFLRTKMYTGDESSISGYLFKKTRDGRWQKRWFLLEGQTMVWYANKQKKKILGSIDVDRCRVELEDVQGRSNAGFVFKLTTRAGKSARFRSDSHKERVAWTDIVKTSGEQTNQMLSNWAKEDECVNCVALAAIEDTKSAKQEDESKPGTEENDEEPAAPDDTQLSTLQIKDTSGTVISLKDVIGKYEFTIVALLRHFG